ncbi:MAG: hypothetical protein HRF46_05130 [Acidobacteriota bacterium]|jgi:hypothetical protein
MPSLPHLPTLAGAGFQAPSCGQVGYVSEEEMTVLLRIRSLSGQARQLKSDLARAEAQGNAGRYHELVARLENLRQERRRLDLLREAAWRRKMIALGHLAEDAPAEA